MAYRGAGFIDVLTAGAAGTEGVYTQIRRIDVDGNGVIHFWIDEYGCEDVWRRPLASNGEIRTNR